MEHSIPVTHTVCAVIVAFYPDRIRLERLLSALARQAPFTVIVDNGSEPGLLDQLRETHKPVEIIRLDCNRGIAAAQNTGVAAARKLGASHVLLLDQDSIPAGDMVARLCATLDSLEREAVKVGCIGSRFFAPGLEGRFAFLRLGPIGMRRVFCDGGAGAIESDMLISSGTLVSLAVIDAVGPMDESLFIDHVDTEWCFRARSLGYRLFGECRALLEHDLGEDSRKIWFGRWRRVHRHKPFRYYYIFRNSILLFRRSYVPAQWVLFEIWYLLGLVILFGLSRASARGTLSMMYRGCCDGLRGVAGRAKEL